VAGCGVLAVRKPRRDEAIVLKSPLDWLVYFFRIPKCFYGLNYTRKTVWCQCLNHFLFRPQMHKIETEKIYIYKHQILELNIVNKNFTQPLRDYVDYFNKETYPNISNIDKATINPKIFM